MAASTAFDPPGLHVLVRAHRHAREAGSEPHLLNPTVPVALLLHLTGVARVLRVSPNPAATTRVAADAPKGWGRTGGCRDQRSGRPT